MDNLIINEENVIKTVLEFLSSRNYHVAMRTLEKESCIVNCNLSNEVLFLRELVLDGDFDEILQVGNSFAWRTDFNHNFFNYVVLRQKFIELIYMKSHILGKDSCSSVEDVVKTLSQLEMYCPSKDEYNNLCWLLTVPNLNEHEEFKNWTLDVSRTKCFEDILRCIENFIPKTNTTSKDTADNDRLLQLIVKGLFYEMCTEYCQSVASGVIDDNCFNADILHNSFQDSPSNLFCWIRSLPYDIFSTPFEQLNVDVQYEPGPNKYPNTEIDFVNKLNRSKNESLSSVDVNPLYKSNISKTGSISHSIEKLRSSNIEEKLSPELTKFLVDNTDIAMSTPIDNKKHGRFVANLPVSVIEPERNISSVDIPLNDYDMDNEKRTENERRAKLLKKLNEHEENSFRNRKLLTEPLGKDSFQIIVQCHLWGRVF